MQDAEYWSDAEGRMVAIFLLTDDEIMFHVNIIGVVNLDQCPQLKMEYERRNLQPQ